MPTQYTKTITWDFSTGTDGWTILVPPGVTSPPNSTYRFQHVTNDGLNYSAGVNGGCLEVGFSNPGTTLTSVYLQKVGRWSDWGVPAGSIIDSIQWVSVHSKLETMSGYVRTSGGDNNFYRGYAFDPQTNAVLAEMRPGSRIFYNAMESGLGFVQHDPGWIVDGVSLGSRRDSDFQIGLWLQFGFGTDSNPTPTEWWNDGDIRYRVDQLVLEVVYHPDTRIGNSNPYLIANHPTVVARGTVQNPRNDFFCIVDNNDATYFEDGLWGEATESGSYVGNFKNSQKITANGTGLKKATWYKTGVPSGSYDIWVTFDSVQSSGYQGDGASNAPYTVYDGPTPLATVPIDQSKDLQCSSYECMFAGSSGDPIPEKYADIEANGVKWKKIGTYTITSGTVQVTLSDNANGPVFADAIRITAAGTLGPCSSASPFLDLFDDNAIACNWHMNAGTWSETGGVLKQTGTTGQEKKARVWHDPKYEKGDMEVRARVRVDTWGGGDGARAGVCLNINDFGQGYNFILYGGNNTFDKVEFLSDGHSHGPSATFTWSVGSWYWMMMRRVGNQLYGKVWADGSPEPKDWTVTWANPTVRVTGYPGLTGGNGGNTVSYDNFSATPINRFDGCGTNTLQRHPTIVASGKFIPRKVGDLTLTKHPTIFALGTHTGPQFKGNASLSKHPTISTVNSSLVAYYRLDDTLSPAIDSGPNGYHAAWSGGPTPTTTRPVLKFKNTSALDLKNGSKVVVPSNVLSSLSTSSAFSMAMWIYPRVVDPAKSMAVFDTFNRHFSLFIGDNRYGSGTYTAAYTPSAPFVAGQWQHVVVTKAGTTFFIYRNGVQVATGPTGSNFFQQIEIGGNPSGGGVPFDGFVDDIRFYNNVLSASDLSILFSGGEPGYNSFYPPRHVGSASVSRKPTFVSTPGTLVVPMFQGSSILSRKPTFTASGGRLVPIFFGDSTLTKHPTFTTTTKYVTPIDKTCRLVIRGSLLPEWIAGMPLFMDGMEPHSGGMELFEAGHEVSNGAMPLTTKGLGHDKKSTSLYIQGAEPSTGSMPLHTIGIGYAERSVPLFTTNFETMTDQSTLFIEGRPPLRQAVVPLYIGSAIILEPLKGLNLHIRTPDPIVARTGRFSGEPGFTPFRTMFIRGTVGTEYGYREGSPSMGLFMKGYYTSANKGLNLYVAQKIVDGGSPLFIRGDVTSNTRVANTMAMRILGHIRAETTWPHIPVFLKAPETIPAGPGKQVITLFIRGPSFVQGNRNLYVKGGDFAVWEPCQNWEEWVYDEELGDDVYVGPCPDPRKISLYLEAGGFRNRSLGLYLARDPAFTNESDQALYIRGHIDAPSVIGIAPLFISSWDELPEKPMNLFIEGGIGPNVGTSRVMNLVIPGGNPTALLSTPLVVCNLGLASVSDAPLFIKGQGGNPGYVPRGKSMGLYINRGPNAGMTLYLANNNETNSTPLFISGHPVVERSATLVITGLGGEVYGTSPLSIRFVSTPSYVFGEATLVMPRVVDGVFGSSVLYVHGWGV